MRDVLAPARPPAPTRAFLGLVCLLAAVFAGACGSDAHGVRNRLAGSFPRTPIISSDGDTATVVPGEQFAAGRLREFFIGAHYRDLWATPIRVPVLNLSTFAGGLTPIRLGGDLQTRSLRLQARDGRQFVFRMVAKDQKKVLPAALRSTLIAEIVQDQVSSMNPAGALVVDELAHALGIYHAHPLLVLAPDDERLGDFRHAFAGRLGLLEEYPVAGVAGSTGIVGADKIVSTRTLLAKLDKNSADRVHSRSFLTARLLDMLIGDWDRHDEQWRWARSKEQGRDVYYALPRDRDQAFARFDGVFPRLAEFVSVQMEHFSENLDDIPNLMHLGRVLDSRILADLDKAAWESVTAEVVARLGDEVIDNSVRSLPQPYYARRGAWLAAALKSRRDQLPAAAASYYRTLAKDVDIRLSDKPELVQVQSLDERCVAVTAHRRGKRTGDLKGGPVFARTFCADETDEVRIQLLGGDDTAVAAGDARSRVAVRILGGAGADEFVAGPDSTGARKGNISFLPRPPDTNAHAERQRRRADVEDRGGAGDPVVAD